MTYKILSVFAFLLISNFSSGQQKKYLQDSVSIYQQIKILKKGKKDYNGILTIDNKLLTQKISKYISEKKEQKIYSQNLTYPSSSLLQQLIDEDQKAIPKIIAILESNDSVKINELFQQYYSPTSYGYQQFGKINSKELIDLLTKTLHQTDSADLQQKIITLLCRFENPEYLTIAENFLVSGNCKSELGAFSTICMHFHVKDYQKSLKYIFDKAISNPQYVNKNNYRLFYNAINSILIDSYDTEEKQKAIDYAFEFIDKRIQFPDADLTNYIKSNETFYLQSFGFMNDPHDVMSLDFITVMIKADDKRIVPYIQKLNELGIKNITSDFILWKYGIDPSEKTFQKLINDYDYFNKVLFVLDQRSILQADNKQLEYIFSSFENKLSYKDYSSDKSGMTRSNGDVFSAAETLYQLDQKKFNIWVEHYIKSNELKNAFYEYYNLNNDRATFLYLKNKEQKKIKSINEPSIYIQPERLQVLNAFISTLKDNQLEIFDLYTSDAGYEIDLLESVLINAKKYSKGELNHLEFYTDYYGDNFKVVNDNNSIFISFNDNTLYNEFVILNDKVYFIEMNKIKNNREKAITELLKTLLQSGKSENAFVPISCCHSINSGAKRTLFSFGNLEKITEIKNKYGFAE
ncbi:hypothetical protein [Chryseobacterium geocarposphaerae]|uniref:Uncharacterized protein n=1 Tax=Chryseobacterium geocarposphaerae TaxID=1416776 RepID=A0A2M9BXU1_9FLAO|nr:hypothetical protein [Chryseobacterium geocarposphaerae]PJJ62886.1 hypothetical protein CLV73_3395 [Chryseobacterium geocarposphaerae]